MNAAKSHATLQRFAMKTLRRRKIPVDGGNDRVHRLKYNAPELKPHENLSTFLRENNIPVPSRTPRGGLFNGTVHFIKVTFQTPNGNFVFNDADLNMMAQYAQHAIVPIIGYATRYGCSAATISSTIIPYTVTLPGSGYNDSDLQGWVNDIVTTNHLPTDSCIVVPSPAGVTASGVAGNAGYHSKANVPYIVFGVFASDLTLQDTNDVYAMVISHELGELVVDPEADWSVGEVGDPCDINCGNLHRAYFDASDNYLGTNKLSPPGGFSFSYYICPVVAPEGIAHSGSDCHATEDDCSYAPADGGDWSFAGNTAGFGHGINDSRPFWIGDFNGDGRSDVLMYYPGDNYWWRGSHNDNQLRWTFTGCTCGFGSNGYDSIGSCYSQ